jgi:hypothetical protein
METMVTSSVGQSSFDDSILKLALNPVIKLRNDYSHFG